ncbi:MAG: TIR domain-containing protein [Alphaproteobacteria bacterium]
MKNVFISHIHEDDEHLGRIKDLLESKRYPIRDSSINSSNPNNANKKEYIKDQILRPQIRWAGTVIVLITPGTRKSEWVDWEIREAVRQGKHVVGVWGHGDALCDLPEAMIEFAFRVVGWNGDSIIDAIEDVPGPWETPEGNSWPKRDLPRRCGSRLQ